MKKVILTALLSLPLSLFAQKFGHFNSQTLLPQMQEYISYQKEVKERQESWQSELKAISDEGQKKISEYQAQRTTLPDAVRERREADIQDLEKRYDETQQRAAKDLQDLQEEKTMPILNKVNAAIKEIGVAGGYVYIMDLSQGIPYVSETLSTDVTAELKTRLGIK